MTVEPVVVGLAEAIGALRAELLSAMDSDKGGRIRFSIEPVELTVQTAVTKDASGKVGWKILGVGASRETATTQTLKLTLVPLWRNDDGTLVRDFTVSDVAGPAAAGDRVGPKPDRRAPAGGDPPHPED